MILALIIILLLMMAAGVYVKAMIYAAIGLGVVALIAIIVKLIEAWNDSRPR